MKKRFFDNDGNDSKTFEEANHGNLPQHYIDKSREKRLKADRGKVEDEFDQAIRLANSHNRRK